MPNTTDIEELDVLRDEKRSDAARAGAGHPKAWVAGQHDPSAYAIHTAEIARLKGIIERALATMEAMHPGSAKGTMTAAEVASMWNATVEMLRAG